MKQTRTRLLSLLLTCAMLLSLLPTVALAAGGGEDVFTIKAPQNALPAELQQVEYIESTDGGQQWIDLGFRPNQYPNQLRSEVDVQFTVLPNGYGLGGSFAKGSIYHIYGVNGSNFMIQIGSGQTYFGARDMERHTFIVDMHKGTAAMDMTAKKITPSSNGVNLALFTNNNKWNYSVCRIYSAKFSYWDEESGEYVLIRDMVPCYAKSEVVIGDVTIDAGTVGMYDAANGKFYANANTAEGAAAFEKGEDVTGITADVTVTPGNPAVLYTGEAVEPEITVKHGEAVLNKDTDYTITCTDNTEVGVGMMTIRTSAEYGKLYIRLPFSITVPTDVYYQEDGEDTRLYTSGKNKKFYMFLPATADYANLKLHLPEGTTLKTSRTLTVTAENNGALNIKSLFPNSAMLAGTPYEVTVTTSGGQTYTLRLIKSAQVPALYINIDEPQNEVTKEIVTDTNPYNWLDSYINQSKDWKSTGGSVVMVDANGTVAFTQSLKSLKGRGNTSWGADPYKKPYNLKLNAAQELVKGAGAAKNWCLISSYYGKPAPDSTGLTHSMAYWLFDKIGGDSPVQYQQMDLYVNGVYRGNYLVTEKVEIDSERVNITETKYAKDAEGNKLEEGTSKAVNGTNTPNDPAILAGIKEYVYTDRTTLLDNTSGGGFLVEASFQYDEPCKFTTKRGVRFNLKDPEYATKEQVQQIALYVQEFEDALFSDTGYNDQGKHYSEYVDLTSLAKKLIVDAFMGNTDTMKASAYFYIDATTSDDNGALKVNFAGKMLAGPAWDYDYWGGITNYTNLWSRDYETSPAKNAQIWQDKLLEKGDFMDALYQVNEKTFKSAAKKGVDALSDLISTLKESKLMEKELLPKFDFNRFSGELAGKYAGRLSNWNNVVWSSDRLMGVTVVSTPAGLLAKVNGTAESYQWYKLDENHAATEIPGKTDAILNTNEAGTYQVKVTGTSMEPLLSTTITMCSAPITVGSSAYTVTLDPKGGTLPVGAESTVTVTPGSPCGELPTPTKEGSYFLGWFTQPQGGTRITAGSTVPAGTDSTIYAQWKATKTVRDVEDVTGVASSSNSGIVTWQNDGEAGAELPGLILYGKDAEGATPSATLATSRLPVGYQEVEYIASTNGGKQYIDTGIVPGLYQDALKSEIDLQYYDETFTGRSLTGVRGGSWYYIYGRYSGLGNFIMRCGSADIDMGPGDAERHTFILDQVNKTAQIDQKEPVDFSASASTQNYGYTVYLFAQNSSGGLLDCAPVRIYSAKFYNRGTLIRDLVPCYEIESGAAGLYDLVEGKFYANGNTTGEKFLVGYKETGETVTSPVALYAVGDARDSYNAVTGVVTRRVKVVDGVATALSEAEWTTEEYEAKTLTQYAGVNDAAYTGEYTAPIAVVYEPASVTLNPAEFNKDGTDKKPDVTVTVNGSTLAETDYTVTYPATAIEPGVYEITVTIDTKDYNGALKRTYTIKMPSTAPEGSISGTTSITLSGNTAENTTTLTADLTKPSELSTVTYQWQKWDGSDWKDIDGKTGASLTLSELTMSNNGEQYHCIVTNTEVGKGPVSTTLDAVTLSVQKGTQTVPSATETQPDRIGATGSITGLTTAMEVSTDSGNTWKTVTAEQAAGGITGIAGDTTYQIRYAETDYLNASPVQTITINAFIGTQEQTPNATFAATGPDTGTLTDLVAGGKYTVTGAATASFTASGTSQELTGISAGTLSLVKNGDNITTTDSDKQTITVTKAAKPAGTVTDETAYQAEDGTITITGYDSGYTYQYSLNGGEWTDATPTSEGKIENLKPGSYVIRVKAKDLMLASDASDALAVAEYVRGTTKDITKFEVTVGGTAYAAAINGTAITLTVPYGSDVSNLTPVITHNGVSISPTSAQNFRTSVEYTVTAEDGSTQTYTVAITVAAPNTYTLTADTQMIHGSITSDPASPISQDAEVTLTVTPDAGYQLKAGTLKAYKSGEENTTVTITDNKLTMPGYDVIVTAEFEPIKYTVTFHSDGSTVETIENVIHGSTITAPDDPTKEGHIFGGWYTDGNVLYNFSTPVTDDITLTAKWTPESYIVSFDSKGGSAVEPQNVNYGDKVTKPADPVREGYGFGNWFKDVECTDQFDFNTYTVTNDVTLYAKWEINKYTVSFDSQGGSAVDSQTVSYGEKVTRPADPTKTGYTFDNWYKGDDQFDFNTYTVTSDVTLYAKWDVNSYTVTFDSNGGSGVDPIPVEYNSTISTPAAPTKAGYTFIGWFTDSGLTNAYDFTAPVTGDITLYAKWNVNYVDDGDGGSSSGGSGGSSSGTTTEKNPDGSTTTVVTKPDGSKTETTTGKPVTDEAGNTTTTKTETVTNKDGSTTQTVTETVKGADGSTSETQTVVTTDKDGATTQTVTETVKGADGSTSETQTVVATDKDGATTTTETVKVTDTTGTTATKVTETNAAGETTTSVEAAVSDKALAEAAENGTSVTLPVEVTAPKAAESAAAPVVKVEVPTAVSAENTVKVEIPVENPTPGTVAVIVKADGTKEIVKTSVVTENGVTLKLDGNVTVKVIDNSKEFMDVHPVNHWAEGAIDFVTAREMFNGTSTTTFTPDSSMTRAQMMTVLARFDGVDTTTGDTWYEKGMEWAKANGVSDGSNPNGSITREQLATMLWRYSGSPAVEGSIDHFSDADKVSDYAADAMRWAVEIGLINGMGDGILAPQGDATRAQLAAILMRYCKDLAE